MLFYSHLLNRIMLRIVEAIIGLVSKVAPSEQPNVTYLLSASVEDPTRPPVVGRLRSSPVLS